MNVAIYIAGFVLTYLYVICKILKQDTETDSPTVAGVGIIFGGIWPLFWIFYIAIKIVDLFALILKK